MGIEPGALADFALNVEAIEPGLAQLAVMDLGLVLGHVNATERGVVCSMSFRVPERTQASVRAVILVSDQTALVLEVGALSFLCAGLPVRTSVDLHGGEKQEWETLPGALVDSGLEHLTLLANRVDLAQPVVLDRRAGVGGRETRTKTRRHSGA